MLAVAFFLSVFGSVGAHADGGGDTWGKSEQAEVESRVMWSEDLGVPGTTKVQDKSFGGGRVRSLWVVSGNLVVADVKFPQKRDTPAQAPKRYLIDGASGATVWEGDVASATPITGKPYPVVVETDEDRYSIRGLSRDGKPKWKREFSDRFVSAVAAPGLILTLAVDRAATESATAVRARVRALSLDGGKALWTAPVGPVVAEGEAGDVDWLAWLDFFVAENDFFLILDDSVYAFSLQSGKQRLRHPIKQPTNPNANPLNNRPLWRAFSGDVVLSLGPQLMRLSPNAGVVWSRQIEDCDWLHGLEVDAEAIAGGLRVEDRDDDDGVVLLDAATGAQKWRQPLEKSKYRAPDGIMMTSDRVLVSGYRKLFAFDRKTGQQLFRVRTEHGLTSLIRRGDRIVLRGTQKLEARAISDGRELWKAHHLTPQERQQKGARFSAGMTAYSLQQGLPQAFPTYYSAHEFEKFLLSLPEILDTPISVSTGETSTAYAYFLTTEGRNPGKPVIVVVDLDTGGERMHRLLRGGNRCRAVAIPVAAEGYVIEGFEGPTCSEFGKRIHAIRIPVE